MNPQIVFNINLAAEAGTAAAGQESVGALSSTGRTALPSPMDVLGAMSTASQRLPTPMDMMDMEVRNDRGERQVPTPMAAGHIASRAVSGSLPTPFDTMRATAGMMTGGLPTPTMIGPMAASGGAARDNLPRPDDLDTGTGYQTAESPEPRPRNGRK